MGTLPQNLPFTVLSIFFLLCYSTSTGRSNPLCVPEPQVAVAPLDVDLLQFALNLEHLEADFFCTRRWLVMGGPPPIGARRANLDGLTRAIITEFGFEEVGHLRAIKSTVGGLPRPLLDLSPHNFAEIFNQALGYPLEPPFDPYANTINYLLASYVIPYMGLVGYVGANPIISGFVSRRLLAGLLGVEAGQDAVIRGMLFGRAGEVVHPYNRTVAEFTAGVSALRNRLAKCGVKDEGVIVPPKFGAEGRTSSNVLSADGESLSYARSPVEILSVVYGTGDEHRPGGFLPAGGVGRIAQRCLSSP
ncbi:unnamed protein product [Spirodela intermedia]|uniref:Uncharacterized protein n=1 Tax=Spirodela intermedia TaxID=51605 RepID=A0A7I8IBM2_SPIIN|nr:unnamed protein product [Spirodela intermedia]CAA6654271.1 unnamed protein product [Spirodela intermedia]